MWDVKTMYDNKSEIWDVFEVKYPELDDIEETDYSTLWNAINFVANSSDEEFINHVAEYFDIPVIYDKAQDKKLTPAVWDLDATVGPKWLGDWCSPEYYMNINLNLIVRLKQLDVNNFNEKTNKRYYELRNSYLSTQNLIQRYNTYYELIKNSGAALREEQKWSIVVQHYEKNKNGQKIVMLMVKILTLKRK